MEDMRADMGGAACVLGALYTAARLNIPINVIGKSAILYLIVGVCNIFIRYLICPEYGYSEFSDISHYSGGQRRPSAAILPQKAAPHISLSHYNAKYQITRNSRIVNIYE